MIAMSRRTLMPIIAAAVLLGAAALLHNNPPQSAARRAPPPAKVSVEVEKIISRDFQVTLNSYGEARAATQSMLVSQVSGQIVSVSEALRSGSNVAKGDILVSVDDRDYRADVMAAEANLLDAQRSVVEERARAEQAALDWKTLGRKDPPNDLVLRKPQLLAAEAKLKASEAALSKAQLALERTNIRAPFDGRVLEHKVDLGQFINAGTQIAELYANDYVEIRLPLCNCDLDFISLQDIGPGKPVTKVKLYSNLNSDRQWDGHLTRVDSAIDSSSRQLHVIARIDRKLDEAGLAQEIKIGEYLTADIAGKNISDAIIIPNKAIYQSSYVYTVVDGLLQRKEINIAWQNNQVALIKDGLSAGEDLVVTPLGQVTSGTKVSIAEQKASTIQVAAKGAAAAQGVSQ